MKLLSVLIILIPVFMTGCDDASSASPEYSATRMTDGMVLEVSPSGDVHIGARASLIVAADGMVYIKGPLTVGDELIVRDGKVQIKGLQEARAAQKQIQELEARILKLEKRPLALESQSGRATAFQN